MSDKGSEASDGSGSKQSTEGRACEQMLLAPVPAAGLALLWPGALAQAALASKLPKLHGFFCCFFFFLLGGEGMAEIPRASSVPESDASIIRDACSD